MRAHLIVSYNRETDVLELRNEVPCPSYGKEIGDGVYLICREDDNRPIGLTILDFTKTYANGSLELPFECEFTPTAVKALQRAFA